MGLFDMFSRKGPGAIKKHAQRVANRRAQNADRWESIQILAGQKTVESVEALLPRFGIRVDPSIVDHEEKDAAFKGIVDAGDVALEPVRRFLHSSEQVSWPIKILEKLIEPTEVVTDLLALLATLSTEYERDPDRKIQLIAYLEDRQDARIVDPVLRFLDDANETVRFHSVGAIFAQEEPDAAREALLDLVTKEESVRVRARIFDGFGARGWAIPADRRDAVRPMLPEGYALDGSGMPRH